MSTFWVSGDEEGERDVVEAGIQLEGEMDESKEEETPANHGQVWEISFGSSEPSGKPKKLPRFLSKAKTQRTEVQTVTVKATPSPVSRAHGNKFGMAGTSKGKSPSSRPNYQTHTPAQTANKSRNAYSAPAKASRQSASAGVTPSSKSTPQSRIAAKSTPSSSSSRLPSATGSKGTSSANSPLSVSAKARSTSAPTSAVKSGSNSTKSSLFSKRKVTPKVSAAKPPGEKTGKKKLTSLWKKRDSKEQVSSPEHDFRSDFRSEGSEGGRGLRVPDKNSQRRALSVSLQQSPRKGRRVGRTRGEKGVRQSTGSWRMYQSSEEVDKSWREGEWNAPSDERGFESSRDVEGSWSHTQQENFEWLRSQQFSPRMQTTPDIALPTSRVMHRKLREVERWVHEVTLHTQQQQEPHPAVSPTEEEDRGRGEVGNEEECRLAAYPEDMASRKVLDLRRWYCMCRPQYSRSCGISSVVSCWNFIFSTIGNGSLPLMTQEEALTLLGFKQPFADIKFGPFTGNATVMRWFKQLCSHRDVSGKAYYLYKPVGKGKTFGLKPLQALASLKEGLRESHTAFIYHCWNHYFCPVGYEEVPKHCHNAYSVGLGEEEVDSWILIGEPSRKHPGIHFKRWDDIVKDLTCESPQCFNIRHPERGIQTRKTGRQGGNLHCIMAFQKQEGNEWGVNGNFSPEPLRGTVSEGRGCTPIETLDSSESDFPREVDDEVDVNDDDCGVQTLRRDNAANFYAASDGSISPSSSLDKSSAEKKTDCLDAGDAPLHDTVAATPPPQVLEAMDDGAQGTLDGDSDKEDQLNITLTPTKEKVVFDGGENTPFVEVESLDVPEGDYTNRSGTYRKSKPSLSPVPLEQLETNPDSSELPMTGDYTKRSGTFRKERPTLAVTTHNIKSDTDPETAEISADIPVPEDLTVQVRPLASPTGPELRNSDGAMLCGTDELESHHETTGMKRSATFRKEKPTLEVSPMVQEENQTGNGNEHEHVSMDMHANQMDFDRLYTTQNSETQPAMSLLASSLVVPSQHEAHPESEDSDSVEETYLLVDSLTVSGVKRTGTFTKEKPTTEFEGGGSLFGDDYF